MPKIVRNFLILGFVALAACSSKVPVYNVESEPLSVSRNVSAKEIERAIIQGGADRGWSVRRVGRGKMEARIAVRSHVAVVDIYYTKDSISINHKDSKNLNYDGKKIHKSYNSWIRYLVKSINQKAAAL